MHEADVTKLTLLKWDSQHFGFRVARAEWSSDPEELESLVRAAEAEDVTLLYLFSPAEAKVPQFLEKSCVGLYASERVDFVKPLSSWPVFDVPQGYKIVELSWENCDRERVRQLGVVVGEYSRFLRDPLIPRGKGEELFRIWAEESVKHHLADVVLGVIGSSHGLLGIIALKQEEDTARIGLLGLSQGYRGRNFATSLVHAGERWAFAKGLSSLRVATQGENTLACAFYLRRGFRESQRQKIFHVWLKKP